MESFLDRAIRLVDPEERPEEERHEKIEASLHGDPTFCPTLAGAALHSDHLLVAVVTQPDVSAAGKLLRLLR